jgi:hypothetical protein
MRDARPAPAVDPFAAHWYARDDILGAFAGHVDDERRPDRTGRAIAEQHTIGAGQVDRRSEIGFLIAVNHVQLPRQIGTGGQKDQIVLEIPPDVAVADQRLPGDIRRCCHIR